MLLSGLAVHTGNLSADPKASLFVFAAEAETATMSAARLNLAGNTARVSDEDAAPLRALYLQRHPDAEQYIDFGDFAFYRLSVTDAYFVAGFGEMGWIAAHEWTSAFGGQ